MTTPAAHELTHLAQVAWGISGDDVAPDAVTGQLAIQRLIQWQDQNQLSFELVRRLLQQPGWRELDNVKPLILMVDWLGGDGVAELLDRMEATAVWIADRARNS